MSVSLLCMVTVIYLIVAFDLFFKGSPGMSLTFGGYALANVGMIWAIWK